MSTDELPRKAVQALRLRLQHVKNHLEPIFSKPLNDISAKLTMTEKYELQVLLSYSLNTLFYIYLRINGSDPQKHAVMVELKRVQKYITKLKAYQGKEAKPNMKLNKEAAGRFIKAAISTNQEESSRPSQSKKKREVIDVYSSSEDEGKTKPAKKKGRVMMDPFSGK
ncbi:unnamed protein product [Rhizopus stolonifer]